MSFAPDRHSEILARLDTSGRVVSATLAEELGVSIDSIRRDLQELEAVGALQRVHGGAVRPLAGKARFLDRLEEDEPAREAVAARAAELITDGQLVAVGGGTTAVELARALRARAARHHPHVEPRRRARAARPRARHRRRARRAPGPRLADVVGAGTVEQLRAVRPDVCVVSPCWLDLEQGVTLRERAEAEVVRAMLERSRRVLVIATGGQARRDRALRRRRDRARRRARDRCAGGVPSTPRWGSRWCAVTARKAMYAVYAVFILNGFMFASWASRIPQVRDGLELNPQQLGLRAAGDRDRLADLDAARRPRHLPPRRRADGQP